MEWDTSSKLWPSLQAMSEDRRKRKCPGCIGDGPSLPPSQDGLPPLHTGPPSVELSKGIKQTKAAESRATERVCVKMERRNFFYVLLAPLLCFQASSHSCWNAFENTTPIYLPSPWIPIYPEKFKVAVT